MEYLKRNSFILKLAIFATGFAGIVAEYTLSTLATYFIGNSIFQWTMIVSLMLFCMGLGSRLSKLITKNLIFSSTAAVYGLSNKELISESTPLNPINPYGSSKLMCERMIQDLSKSSNLKFFILRYFNVAGADPFQRSGQSMEGSTHLIKVCIECALRKRKFLELYGNDYNTEDWTCIRDFIHVTDLISGHILAIQHLVNGGNSDICNLGYGKGYSVLEIIKKVKSISGYDFPVITSNRREGDAPFSVSNPTKMKSLYNWNPIHNIDDIILSMLNWEKKVNKYPLNE